MSEQRSDRRFKIELEASYRIRGYSKESTAISVLDINPSGLCLTCDKPIGLKREIELTVNLEEEGSVDLFANVVWEKMDPQTRKCTVGVKIKDKDKPNAQKFRAFYNDKLIFPPSEE